MKKVVVALLLVAVLLSMTSCGLAVDLLATIGLSAVNGIAPDYKAAECEFEFADISFTLTEAFGEVDAGEIATYTSYALTQVMVERIERTGLFGYNSSEELAEEHKEMLSMGLYEISFGDIIKDGDVTYFTYTISNGGSSVTTFFSFYVNEYAAYIFSFLASADSYETYEPYFIKWATSVKTISSGSQI